MVVAFISVPTELALWRKTAALQIVEEFYASAAAANHDHQGAQSSGNVISDEDFIDAVSNVRKGLADDIETYV